MLLCLCFLFFQAEDGIRDLVRSRGLGDVYKRQGVDITGESLTGYFESVLRDLNERERRLNVGAVAVVLGSPDVGLGGHEA